MSRRTVIHAVLSGTAKTIFAAPVVFGILSHCVVYADEPAEVAKAAEEVATAQEPIQPTLPPKWSETFRWRSIGPANMGGRITAIAVYEKDPCTYWVATASGGLLKTVNNGITFEHQFDHENTVSIGDMAVAQSDPNIVWVGTGEANPRNSVSWGDGVYKSTDGGKTWTHMGLKRSFQIGRIAIHPTNPDIVYVGALGRLWGPNEERGLFKTTDGGKTWEKVLYIDDKTGVMDVKMHPAAPQTLLVATWERQRDEFDTNSPAKKWGPGSGVHKTTDGGKTWRRITEGLPSCELGRMGIDFYRKDPNTVYMVLESEHIGREPENAAYMGIRAEDVDVGARFTEITKDGPAEKAKLKKGDIVVSVDDKTVHSYNGFLTEIRKRAAGDTVKVEVSRERKSVFAEVTFAKRPGGDGKNDSRRRSPFSSVLGGQRENIQEQQGPKGHEYGGIYQSTDAGDSWTRINSVNPRPMYFSEVRIDPSDNNYLYVLGIQLYRSKDGGKTLTPDGGRGVHPDHHAMWIDPSDGRHMILGTDGGLYVTHDRMEKWDHLNHMAIGQFYHVAVDATRNYKVYGGLQDNGSWGGPSRVRDGSGPINEDWFRVGGSDGFVCRVDQNDPDQVYVEAQNGGLSRYNLRTGERGMIRPRPTRGQRYRFNWRTPFSLSSHNSAIYYTAANYVFRSLNQGRDLKTISPEITRTERGSATALAESHHDSDVLYVGTDDGALWGTRDGGHEWTKLVDFGEDESKKEDKSDKVSEGEASKDAEAAAKTEPAGETGAGARIPPAGARIPSRTPPAARRDSLFGPPPGQDQRPARGGRMIQFLKGLDANGDGKIQKDELPSDRLAPLFDRVDANDDGVLDEDELSAVIARMGGAAPEAEHDPTKEPPDQKKPASGDKPPVEEGEQPPTSGEKSEVEPKPTTGDAPPPSESAAPETGVSEPPAGDQTGSEVAEAKGDEEPAEKKHEPPAEVTKPEPEAQEGVTKNEEPSAGEAPTAKSKESATAAREEPVTTEEPPPGEQPEADPKQSPTEVKEGVAATNEPPAGEEPTAEPQESPTEAQQDAPTVEEPPAGKEPIAEPKESPPEPQEGVVTAKEPSVEEESTDESKESPPQTVEAAVKAQEPSVQQEPVAGDANKAQVKGDPITGEWSARVLADNIPPERAMFTLKLTLTPEDKLTGSYISQMSEGEVIDGRFERKSGKLTFVVDTGRITLEVNAALSGSKMTGDVDVGGGMFTFDFEGERTRAGVAHAKGEKKQTRAEQYAWKPLNELLPGPRCVSSIEASRFDQKRAYVTFDGHRSDDDEPYIFVTENYGETWRPIRSNLPMSAGSTRVIREDVVNPNLLYLGTEFGAWVSVDRGTSWTRLNSNLPTVAVHEIAVHPTAGEIVAATHGRSLWILDVTPLRQMTDEAVVAKAHLYEPSPGIYWRSAPRRGGGGARRYVGQNPPSGARISYSINQQPRRIKLEITDQAGETVRELEANPKPGLHQVTWDLRHPPPQGSRSRWQRGRPVESGKYVVALTVDNQTLRQELAVQTDPQYPDYKPWEQETWELEALEPHDPEPMMAPDFD